MVLAPHEVPWRRHQSGCGGLLEDTCTAAPRRPHPPPEVVVTLVSILPNPWGSPANKHHCQHCLRRVCDAHFAPMTPNRLGGVSRTGLLPICTVCAAAGVTSVPSKKK